MTTHIAMHVKTPTTFKKFRTSCYKMARRYVRAHRRYHLLVVGVIFAIEIAVIVAEIHDPKIHVSVAGITWGWDTFIILLGEVDGE